MKTTKGRAEKPAQEFLEASRISLQEDFMPRMLYCIDHLSDSDLWWRPNDTSNSIGNLVLHLDGNMRQWILETLGGTESYRDRDGEFAARGPMPKPELRAKIESAVRDVVSFLESFDTEKLQVRHHVQAYDVTALQAIYHVVEHFSYHLGQIIYIYKLRSGGDPKFYEALSAQAADKK
jgi:uncharacterized damage-inducible protein DinB